MVLRGPSGSGKSTFLNCIAGITRPTRGEIYLCGKRIDTLREAEMDRERASQIGYIFQNFNLLPGLTVLENILLPMMITGVASKAKALEILEMVGLGDHREYVPGQLSVGQKQRAAVARVLANAPKLVLADEPTASLDTDQAYRVLHLIRETCEREKAALLIVSHQESVAAQFERRIDFRDLNFKSGLSGVK